MGKIILNNIEYGIGISNGYNIDITNLVEKDNIVTVIDENVTDEDIPSAKAVYDKLSDLPTDSGSKCYTTLDELGIKIPILGLVKDDNHRTDHLLYNDKDKRKE